MSDQSKKREPLPPDASPEFEESIEPSAAELNEASMAYAALRGELAEVQDRCLRLTAELENTRRRARRELEDELKYANQHLLRDLLPVIDNVGRAIAAGNKAADASTVLDGCKMLAQQFETVLAKHHCRRIEAIGKAFDPHQHAAILQQPSDTVPPNTVVNVAQEGYALHDRVLRPAQVIVSSSANPESDSAS